MPNSAWPGKFVVDYLDPDYRQGFQLFDHAPGARRFCKQKVETGGQILHVYDPEGQDTWGSKPDE